MKYLLWLLFYCAFNLFYISNCIGQEKSAIEMKIKGYANKVCYLGAFISSNQYKPIDSVITDDTGSLRFKNIPGKGLYVLETKDFTIDFILDGRNISLVCDTIDPIYSMVVMNSEENKIYFTYRQFILNRKKAIDSLNRLSVSSIDIRKHENEIEHIKKSVYDFRNSFLKQYAHSLTAKIILAAKNSGNNAILTANSIPKEFGSINFQEPALLNTPYFYRSIERFQNYISNLPIDSALITCDLLLRLSSKNDTSFMKVFNYILSKSKESGSSEMEKLYVELSEKYIVNGNSNNWNEKERNLVELEIKKMKPLLAGTKVPEMILATPSSDSISIYDIKAEFTILYFWDSQCSHCLETTPELYNLYTSQKEKRIEVCAITLEQSTTYWTKFIEENKMNQWVNVWHPIKVEKMYHYFNLITTPAIILLDKEKRIVRRNLSIKELNTIFNEYN